jgi:CubicO group peptidase (beta-lactamase class C family)
VDRADADEDRHAEGRRWPPRKPNFAAYGLGFQLRDYKGLVAMHGGALQGFYSRVLLVPESKLGIAILTNAESGGALNALQYRLLDQYMGSAPTDWIKLIADDEPKHTRRNWRA